MKNEKIIISGPSGSGKDYLVKELINKELKYLPKFTTRPKRYNEIDGVEYNFISIEEFNNLKISDQIKVYQEIKVNEDIWYYGLTNECFDKSGIFIMTPSEINQLSDIDIKKCFIVYLDIDENVRESRILERNDNNDSVKRRINSDKIDFDNFKKYDLKITDPEFEVDWIYDLMY